MLLQSFRPKFIISFTILSPWISPRIVAARYSDATCCNLARAENAFINSPATIICGQEYNASIGAAHPLMIPYSFCTSKCPGFGLAEGRKPGQWAAPIVQFILPSIIFSMSIPRRYTYLPNLDRQAFLPGRDPGFRAWFRWHGWSLVVLFASALLMAIDTLIWVFIIMCLAGHDGLWAARSLAGLRHPPCLGAAMPGK